MAKTPTTGRRLNAWLAHRNRTMRETARRTGITVQMISLVAADERDISVAKLNRICRSLDCSLAEFFGPLPERAA